MKVLEDKGKIATSNVAASKSTLDGECFRVDPYDRLQAIPIKQKIKPIDWAKVGDCV